MINKMRIIGIDYGQARVGIAVSDLSNTIASAVGTVEARYYPERISKTANIINEYKPCRLVVGLPKNMDNTEGHSAQAAREFASSLMEQTGVEVDFYDERLTTVSAHRTMNELNIRGSKKRRNVVDTIAAVILLQAYLDSIKR